MWARRLGAHVLIVHSTPRNCILIVDDDTEIRESLAFLLEAEGHDVVTASDGREALGLLRTGLVPSLILLDLMMPDMDGRAFHTHLVTNTGWKHIPIIIMSGVHNARDTAEQIGVAGALQKPIDIEALRRLVGTLRASM